MGSEHTTSGDGEVCVQYRVLTAPSTNGLEAAVRRMLVDGWMPLGGVAMSVSLRHVGVAGDEYEDFTFSQAMILPRPCSSGEGGVG